MKKVVFYFSLFCFGLLAGCTAEWDPAAEGVGAGGGAVSGARAFFEAEAGRMDGIPDGGSFSPGEFSVYWDKAQTFERGGVRYVAAPINPHYYYSVVWDTDKGMKRAAAFQRLVVTTDLSTGARRCLIATLVPRDDFSRQRQNPATRFEFGGDAGRYHGLVFTSSLDGTAVGFRGYDNGALLFDVGRDGHGVVAGLMRRAYGASEKLSVSRFWLTRGMGISEGECMACVDQNCRMINCEECDCINHTVKKKAEDGWDMAAQDESDYHREHTGSNSANMSDFWEARRTDPGNEHAISFDSNENGKYSYGLFHGNGTSVNVNNGGYGSVHSHPNASGPSATDIISTGWAVSQSGSDSYSASYIVTANNGSGTTQCYGIIVTDPLKAARFHSNYGDDLDHSTGCFSSGSDIGGYFNNLNGNNSFSSPEYINAMDYTLYHYDAGMTIVSFEIDEESHEMIHDHDIELTHLPLNF